MERLVLTSQSLLTLIADLKRQALLSDFSSMNKIIDDKRSEYELDRLQRELKIDELLALRFDQVLSETLSSHLEYGSLFGSEV